MNINKWDFDDGRNLARRIIKKYLGPYFGNGESPIYDSDAIPIRDVYNAYLKALKEIENITVTELFDEEI